MEHDTLQHGVATRLLTLGVVEQLVVDKLALKDPKGKSALRSPNTRETKLASIAKRDSATLAGLMRELSAFCRPVSAHSLTDGGASMQDMLAASTKSSEIMLITTSPVSMMLRKVYRR